MITVSRNRGGAYIICDLDGTLVHAPVAAFRVVPYFARHELDIPDLEEHLDVSVTRLRELEHSTTIDPDDPEIAEPSHTDNCEELTNDDANSDEEEERVSISQ
jgi:FMN phosphatase YigB (HAD superfamily)